MSYNSRARDYYEDVFVGNICMVLFLGFGFCHNVEILGVLVLVLNYTLNYSFIFIFLSSGKSRDGGEPLSIIYCGRPNQVKFIYGKFKS